MKWNNPKSQLIFDYRRCWPSNFQCGFSIEWTWLGLSPEPIIYVWFWYCMWFDFNCGFIFSCCTRNHISAIYFAINSSLIQLHRKNIKLIECPIVIFSTILSCLNLVPWARTVQNAKNTWCLLTTCTQLLWKVFIFLSAGITSPERSSGRWNRCYNYRLFQHRNRNRIMFLFIVSFIKYLK